MGSTYLDLTNKVLRKLNEVELTSANFSSATGLHALAKDAVNYSINDINTYEYRWPWNYTEATQVLVADQAEYAFPTDMKIMDWSTFFLQADDALDVNPQRVFYITYEDWHNTMRVDDQTLNSSGGVALPRYIYNARNGKFGVSPIPDRAYTLEFKYWADQDQLSLYSDTTSIPASYDKLIISGAIGHLYDFRENYEMSSKEFNIFRKALKHARAVEINDQEIYLYDTRVGRNRHRNWAK